MKSNFYEKIFPMENEETRRLLKRMSDILDESLNEYIELKKRKNNEQKEIKAKIMGKIEIEEQRVPQENIGNIVNDTYVLISRLRERTSYHSERLQRIRNMEEETESLNRLIESDNIEVVG